MANNCLVGCISANSCAEPLHPDLFDILTPYIEITFIGVNGKLTVGNESAPGYKHKAIIKSFEYGMSDGHKADIEIIDEQGGVASAFLDEMLLSNIYNIKDLILTAKWGWINSNCFGSDITSIGQDTHNDFDPITLFPNNIEVQYGDGYIHYKVTCTDLGQGVFVSRQDNIIGSDDQPVTLKDAIRTFMAKHEPPMRVEFLRKNTDGTITEWEFENGKDWPKGKWPADNRNKIDTVRSWVRNYKTDNGRGIRITIDNQDKQGRTLILWEDQKKNEGCQASLGTFLVNAGNCSNALSFTPNINLIVAQAIYGRGGGQGPMGAAGVKKQDDPLFSGATGDKSVGGIERPVVGNEVAKNNYGPSETMEKISQSQEENAIANSLNAPNSFPVEAELKTMGLPYQEFVDLKRIVGQSISIVVLNPFSLHGSGDKDCPMWLAQPLCSSLSDKNWMIKGIAHSIRDGSYITTFKVFRATVGFR